MDNNVCIKHCYCINHNDCIDLDKGTMMIMTTTMMIMIRLCKSDANDFYLDQNSDKKTIRKESHLFFLLVHFRESCSFAQLRDQGAAIATSRQGRVWLYARPSRYTRNETTERPRNIGNDKENFCRLRAVAQHVFTDSQIDR